MVRILFISILISWNAFSQIEISGYVVDDMDVPMQYISITSNGSVLDFSTDENGYFEFTYPSDSAVLTFSYFGFEPVTITILESKSIKIVLHQQNFGPIWPSGLKPISTEKSKFTTMSIYSIDTISLQGNKLNTNLVIWDIDKYKIFLPLDSLVDYLKKAKYRSDDMAFGLRYLATHEREDTIHLSKEFLDKVGIVPLNNLSIKMISVNSIIISDEHGYIVSNLILKEFYWFGRKRKYPGCWGGVHYLINNLALFYVTKLIC